MIKSAIFQSLIALKEWEKINYPFVKVMSVTYPNIEFGYDVSRKLMEPNIEVTYLEFPRDEI